MHACKQYNKTNKHKRFKREDVVLEQKVIDSIPVFKPDITAVQDDLYFYDVKHPEIVLQQAIWETGWFKSDVCKDYNNLFGFKTDKGYLKFDTWQESIQYYKNWQDRKYDSGNYYQFLMDLPYSGDSLYDTHLKSIHVNKR
jgi:uncharacterized FlgJ-related protein